MNNKKLLLLIFGIVITSQMIYAQVPSYVPTNGLVGYWPFNGNANDASGNNLNGTVTGATLTTDRNGVANGAYLFNSAVASNISIQTQPITGTGLQNQFSIVMWVKANRVANYIGESALCSGSVSVPMANSNQNWAFMPSNSGTNLGVGFSIGTNGIMVAEHANNLLVSRLSNSSTYSNFVQVAIVYDSSNCYLYVNGTLVRTRTMYCSSNIKMVPSLLSLGTSLYSPNFSGIIDDLGVWNRALTASEIQLLYTGCSTASPTGSSSQTLCSGSTVANLTATGTNIKWYSTSTGGTALASTTALVNGTTYYASQTVNGCESTSRLAVTVVIQNTIVPTFTQVPAICSGAPLSPIPTTSTNGITGSWSPALNNTTTTTYTFTPTVGQCATTTTMTIVVNSAATPTGSTLQTLCSGSTVANLTATGTNIKWYATSTGGTVLASTTALVNGTTYYASQTVNGCESASRLAVIVSLNNPTVSATTTTVCSGQPTTLSASSGASSTSNFTVGSIGPAGGYVFYDQGSVINGWRYLEVAPSDISSAAEWGCLGTTISGIANTIGTGQNNTNLIIAGCSTPGIASRLCDQASINGFSDWYLPSKDEFNSIYQNLFSIGLGNFDNNTGPNSSVTSTNRYWTSSQVTPFGWAQDFTPYFQQIVGKSELCRVRPIRQFSSGTPFSSYLWSTGATTTSINVNPTSTTQYWVDVTTNGVTCRKFITITVNSTTPAPTGSSSQTLCSGSTIANLTATGTNIQWYSTSTGGIALASTTALVNGTTYYASQTVNGCESTSRLAVIVSLNNPTVSASSTTICGGTNVTLTANSNLTTTQIQAQVNNLVNSGLWNLLVTYNGHYYLQYQTRMTWPQAKILCEQNGGYMYCVNSQLENDNVSVPIANSQVYGDFLLGLYQDTNDPNYSEPAGGWRWLDGSTFSYTNWASISSGWIVNEPSGGTENFGIMDWSNTGPYWNDTYDNINGTVVMEYIGNSTFLWSTGAITASINVTPTTTTQYWVDITTNGVTCRKYITISVNQQTPEIVLSSSNSPLEQVCQNMFIQNITYSIINADSVSVTGLPAGLMTNYNSGVLTISGPPNEWGFFNYTINATGFCSQSVSYVGYIDVIPMIIPTFYPVSPICAGEILNPLPTTSIEGITGNWSPSLNNMVTTEYVFLPDSCASGITMTIVVNSTPPPTGSINQSMIQGSTLSNLVVTGQSIQWYSTPFGGTPLPLNTPLINGTTYYASQTINGCESQNRFPVIVQVTLSSNDFDEIQFVYSPNPVIDILNIKSSINLNLVSITNVLGQLVSKQSFNSNEVQMEMNSIPTGTYFVIVEAGDKKQTFKVLKK